MDYERFLSTLPGNYDDWGQRAVRPKIPRFAEILSQVKGMTTPNVLQLLNAAVSCMEPHEVYCEIGSYHGSTVIGALTDHPDIAAYAIDNFTQFDQTGEGRTMLNDNLMRFGIHQQVVVMDHDFEAFFFDPNGAVSMPGPIGVYLYDAAHDYRSQLMGLLMVRPFLAERAVIIVDDANWQAVDQANGDFMSVEPCADLTLRLTPSDGHHSFWNGVHVLTWSRARSTRLLRRPSGERRNIELLEAMKRFAADYE